MDTVPVYRIASITYNESNISPTCNTPYMITNSGLPIETDQWLNIGNIINPATLQPAEPTHTIHIRLQLLDSSEAIDGAVIPANISWKLGGNVVHKELLITAQRSGAEVPSIMASMGINGSDLNQVVTVEEGEQVVINLEYAHSSESQRECVQMMIIVYLPSSMKYVSHTPETIPAPDRIGDQSVIFTVEPFGFGDTMNLQLTLETEAGIPNGIANTPLIMEGTCEPPFRGSTIYTEGTTHPIEFQYVQLNVKGADPCSQTIIPVHESDNACVKANREETGFEGHNAFSSQAEEWWRFLAQQDLVSIYIQVDLGKLSQKFEINSIEIVRDDGENSRYADSAHIFYSQTALAWTRVVTNENALIYNNDTNIAQLTFTHSTSARFLKFVIVSTNTINPANSADVTIPVAVKIRLLGCVVSENIPLPVDACTTSELNNVASVAYENGYAISTDTDPPTVYICEYNAQLNRPRCYSSSDGAKWTAVASKVRNILGSYSNADNGETIVLGLASDGQTYLQSKDGGKTWKTINPNKYIAYTTEVGGLNYKAAVKVENLQDDHMQLVDDNGNGWVAKADGMHKVTSSGVNADTALSWKCCLPPKM